MPTLGTIANTPERAVRSLIRPVRRRHHRPGRRPAHHPRRGHPTDHRHARGRRVRSARCRGRVRRAQALVTCAASPGESCPPGGAPEPTECAIADCTNAGSGSVLRVMGGARAADRLHDGADNGHARSPRRSVVTSRNTPDAAPARRRLGRGDRQARDRGADQAHADPEHDHQGDDQTVVGTRGQPGLDGARGGEKDHAGRGRHRRRAEALAPAGRHRAQQRDRKPWPAGTSIPPFRALNPSTACM